jgi:hypothetical protein
MKLGAHGISRLLNTQTGNRSSMFYFKSNSLSHTHLADVIAGVVKCVFFFSSNSAVISNNFTAIDKYKAMELRIYIGQAMSERQRLRYSRIG